MENRKTSFMKRAAMFVMALAVVLTTVLVPVPAKAAAADAFVVSSYTMAKGEKWTLNVYNADNAKISYKSSKKSVATVSKKGVVTAKKAGTATITVTVKDSEGTYQAKTKIKVKKDIKQKRCQTPPTCMQHINKQDGSSERAAVSFIS